MDIHSCAPHVQDRVAKRIEDLCGDRLSEYVGPIIPNCRVLLIAE